MQEATRGLLQHAKTLKGRTVQSDHAAIHRVVKLTNDRLEEAKAMTQQSGGVCRGMKRNKNRAEEKRFVA